MSVEARFAIPGRRALVTGSSRGIGRAIAVALADAGATVALHGSRDSGALAEALSEVQALQPDSIALTADLADPEAVAGLVPAAVEALGGLDILVANASVQIRRPWHAIPADEAMLQMQVNFHATLAMVQAAAPAMASRGWGRVVTVGSVQELSPHPNMAVYAASKAAQENLVRNLAKQLAPQHVTVNNLSPGVVSTERNADVLADAEVAAKVAARIPLGEFALAEDMAGAALLLCSDAGRYITGATIVVDGGLTLR